MTRPCSTAPCTQLLTRFAGPLQPPTTHHDPPPPLAPCRGGCLQNNLSPAAVRLARGECGAPGFPQVPYTGPVALPLHAMAYCRTPPRYDVLPVARYRLHWGALAFGKLQTGPAADNSTGNQLQWPTRQRMHLRQNFACRGHAAHTCKPYSSQCRAPIAVSQVINMARGPTQPAPYRCARTGSGTQGPALAVHARVCPPCSTCFACWRQIV